MLSVIIPTLWRAKEITLKLIEMLEQSPFVFEIVLIDNSKKPPALNGFKKLYHIKEYRNTYYCPAVNKGVALSSSSYICICNDDVLVRDSVHSIALDHLNKDIGIIGLANFVEGYSYDPTRETKIKRVFKREQGFACIYYIHKDNWINIPKELKIYFGDDYQLDNIQKPHFAITNPDIRGLISKTSNDPEFDKLKEKDRLFYLKY